ncbi:sel1 repeat family protein [Vibrio vulnificus]|nr:sel1 repeat family protein [Vibrio vulnificus]
MEKYCNSFLDKLVIAKSIKNPREAREKIDSIVKEIKFAAKEKNKEAIVAYCYLQILGYKVEQNAVAGRERLSQMITKQRCPEAMFFVAIAYHHGDLGYPEDKTKSEQWFRDISVNSEMEVCERKRAVSAKYVGDLFKEGVVVSKDLAEAARFYSIASELGCEQSSLLLGVIYLNGAEGVFGTILEKDSSRGLSLLRSLAENGNSCAIEAIVVFHLREAMSWCLKSNDRSEVLRASVQALESIEWRLQ